MYKKANPKRYSRRRHFLLLEVLISFALIALCVLPLISSHVSIYKLQRQFVDKIELDHVVNLIFGEIYGGLYRNEIPLATIIGPNEVNIEPEMLQRAGWDKPFPYKGNYKFDIVKYKPKKEEAFYKTYLFNLTLSFTPQNQVSNPITYEYKIFIEYNRENEMSGQQQAQPQDNNATTPQNTSGAAPQNPKE